jgi:hypothetical protein
VFHGVMPYAGGEMLSWKYQRQNNPSLLQKNGEPMPAV